ncbi:MAG: flagellin, partial [Thermogutta sp.]
VDVGSQQGAALLGNSDAANTGLTIEATDYGSDAFVSVKSLSGNFVMKNSAGQVADRAAGTDARIRVNGYEAVTTGLTASINTASVDMSFSIASNVAAGTRMSFSVVGGGAQFQLGPNVVSNQQARVGIRSVNTAKLGGSSGRLQELRSGGSKSLSSDVIGAAAVVDEVISLVTNLRGRLGAFQRTTLETNIKALNDTLENLTAAESNIRDADFAAESAKLTRAQILVQSGTSVLSIANQNPQAVLALLR